VFLTKTMIGLALGASAVLMPLVAGAATAAPVIATQSAHHGLIAPTLPASGVDAGVAASLRAVGYVPVTSVSVSGDRRAGGVVVVDYAAGSFEPGEKVVVRVTGAGGFVLTTELVAGADGSLRYTFTVPADGAGSYAVTATGLASGNIGVASIDIVPADAGGAGAAGTPGSSSALPSTGVDNPLLFLWVASGSILLAGAFFATATLRRRQLTSLS
jgi:hypothetical protein